MMDWHTKQRLEELTHIIQTTEPGSPERVNAAIRAMELLGKQMESLPKHLLEELVGTCDRHLIKAIDAGECAPFSAVERVEDREIKGEED